MPTKSPSETAAVLRQPLEPAHGVWELYRRLCDAAATIIEQNEQIIALLGPTEKPK
jgi:hypothetical protein